MEYVKLGKSDLRVSRICMGCMGFGNAATGQHNWTVDEEATRSIIKRGLDLGINFYDTAIAYQAGTSEAFLGIAIREYAKRDDVVIATKFLPRSQDEIANGISEQVFVTVPFSKWNFRKRACASQPGRKSFSSWNGLC